MSKNLELKPINSLLKEKFYIPSYQRGYRWSKEEVTDLLKDIWEFSQKDKSKDEFYCLQPIVVKKKYIADDMYFEVIDGQQRITTIYIILTYLDKQRYSLRFQTRKDSEFFLKNLSLNTLSDSNIDYHFISEALDTISKWFINKEENEDDYTAKDEFYITLGKFTKFIWYEVKEKTQDEIDVFTRINMGKIPLTNAELIKALLLRSDNFKSDDDYIRLKQLEIASEWDAIEYKLQENNFWYFLNDSREDKETRIEFIFDLISKKEGQDSFFTFHFFNEMLNNQEQTIDEIWKEIKSYFMTFVEWYENDDIYHLIGYLVSIGVNVKEIKDDSKGFSKKEFRTYLEESIQKKLKKINLPKLEYGQNNEDIKKVLLLHNVITLINNHSSMRFPFDKYKDKKEKWSLEHIHAQNSQGLESYEKQKSWLIDTLDTIKNIIDIDKSNREIILSKCNNLLLKDKFTDEEFQDIQKNIFQLFGDFELHTIDNLALLSSRHNSKLNNSIFPMKRDIIIDLDKIGAFIPISTKNVFLKYYSTNLSQIYFWNEADRNDYYQNIEDVLGGKFLTIIEKEESN